MGYLHGLCQVLSRDVFQNMRVLNFCIRQQIWIVYSWLLNKSIVLKPHAYTSKKLSPSHPQGFLGQISEVFILHPGKHCPAGFIPIYSGFQPSTLGIQLSLSNQVIAYTIAACDTTWAILNVDMIKSAGISFLMVPILYEKYRSSRQKVFYEKVFLKIPQNSQESTYTSSGCFWK